MRWCVCCTDRSLYHRSGNLLTPWMPEPPVPDSSPQLHQRYRTFLSLPVHHLWMQRKLRSVSLLYQLTIFENSKSIFAGWSPVSPDEPTENLPEHPGGDSVCKRRQKRKKSSKSAMWNPQRVCSSTRQRMQFINCWMRQWHMIARSTRQTTRTFYKFTNTPRQTT